MEEIIFEIPAWRLSMTIADNVGHSTAKYFNEAQRQQLPDYRGPLPDVFIRELKQEDFSRRCHGEIREGPGLTSSFLSQI